MPLTPIQLAQTATGWTNSDYATSAFTDVATAVCPSTGGVFTQSPSLVLGQFQLDCLGVALINSLFIRVCASSDASNPVLNVYLARNGVQRGSIKTIPLTTTLQEMTLGGDLWGTALTDGDGYNLQVVCYVTALDGRTHYISYVSARADVPAGDAIPTVFTFAAQTNVVVATVRTSDLMTVAGTDIASCISVFNGEWEKNGSGTWSTADGSALVGNTIKVRHTSSAAAGATTSTVLTVGSISGTFASTTTTIDTVPDTITFPSGSTGGFLPLATYINSGAVAITGINAPSPISIVGGQYSINGAPFTAASGTINNLQLLEIRCLSSTSYNTMTSCTVNVGGVTRLFQVTTLPKYGTFTPHFFTTQTGVSTMTMTSSNTITLLGWEEAISISASGGELSVNGGTWTTGPVTVYDGMGVQLRHMSAATAEASRITTLFAQGALSAVVYYATFTTTTAGADITPAAFSFTSLTNVLPSQTFTTTPFAIADINTNTPVSASGTGLVSINGAAYVASGSITAGQTLAVKLTSGAQPGYTTTTTVTVGTVSASYSVTTHRVVHADF